MAKTHQSKEQRRDALKKGNEVRSFRRQLKSDLKTGKIKIEQILLDPPKEINNMKIVDILIAVPYVGQHRINLLLRNGRFLPAITIGHMTSRQREELCTEINKVLPR
jgi:hypothetical protein